MNILTKIASAAALVTASALLIAPAANAGTWHLNARACPDLREDWRDARVNTGRFDRREDRRDQRVIDCPARAWSYVPDRYERGYRGVRHGTPGRVYEGRRGGYYQIVRGGRRVPIDVVIDYGRRGAYGHRGRGRYVPPHRGRGRGRH